MLTSCSCKKENDSIFKDKGVLYWTGEYDGMGCGFFIAISDSTYKPENESIINDSFKTADSINVLIEYEILNISVQYFCFDLPFPESMDGIKILIYTPSFMIGCLKQTVQLKLGCCQGLHLVQKSKPEIKGMRSFFQ